MSKLVLKYVYRREINSLGPDGKTVFHRVLKKNWVSRSSLQLLLEAGADPNIVTHQGEAAVHYAAWQGNVEALQELLSYGADLCCRNTLGRSVLHYAIASSSSS
jgi:ankyrin repeat protein